ncbi:MAG: divalent-cation tolerance protein CutA [Chloroflexi bacterium]|nr:divalent-cation tolerance protein CutA [Chloroflexota bacterium]
MAGHLVVLITTSSTEEAQKIAHNLVGERLAACVNIVAPVHSVYRWRGEIQTDQEALLIVKTKADILEKLVQRVKQLHSYEVPEIIALPIISGAEDYLHWINEQIQAVP